MELTSLLVLPAMLVLMLFSFAQGWWFLQMQRNPPESIELALFMRYPFRSTFWGWLRWTVFALLASGMVVLVHVVLGVNSYVIPVLTWFVCERLGTTAAFYYRARTEEQFV